MALEDMMIFASEMLEVCGGNENATWVALDRHAMEKLKFFRHAIPEAIRGRGNKSDAFIITEVCIPKGYLTEEICSNGCYNNIRRYVK